MHVRYAYVILLFYPTLFVRTLNVDLQDIIAVLLELGELQPRGSRLRRSQQLVPVAVGRHVSAES